jgi:hypothetical protein
MMKIATTPSATTAAGRLQKRRQASLAGLAESAGLAAATAGSVVALMRCAASD